MRAVGEIEGELDIVIFVGRGDVRRIISARSASRTERREMAEIRTTAAEVMVADDVDRARVATTTEAEVQRYMGEDGEEPDGDG